MIPGLSGGSCAMVLNIYDKLLNSIDNIFNNFIENTIFLIKVFLGIIVGILFFSFALYKITTIPYFSIVVKFIIIINIILLLKDFKLIKFQYILLVVIGVLLMFILNNNLSYDITLNLISISFIGVLLAISLILPGLGASYVLYILNLYDTFNDAIVNIDILFLFKISLATLIGIILTTKFINFLLHKDKLLIYSIVIGFLIGSF